MKKFLLLLVSIFACSGAYAQGPEAYDDLGNLIDPPGEEVRFQLYAWVRGGYEMGRKYYETCIRFDGNDVYFYNICPTAMTDTWVKGSYIDENTIRVLPQKYFTEMTDVGPYTTNLAMWHGKKVGYDQAGTQYDHYDFKVGTDDKGKMTLTCVDKDDWLSVVDKVMQGIYDFSSELEYTMLNDELPTDIVTEQPAGRRQRYSMMANFYSEDDGEFWADFGFKADVVWGDDGNVYFYSLTPDNDEAYGWIKGEYDQEKNIITVAPDQCVGYIKDYDVYSYLVGYDWDNNKALDTPLYFQVNEDGWIYATDEAEEQYVATIYRQGNVQKGLSAINQYLTLMPVKEEPVVAPEQMEIMDYTLSYYETFSEGEQQRTVQVGFDNNEVYIKGLSETMPEGWIKGTVDSENGKIHFPSRQLMAADDSNVYLYFSGGAFNMEEEFPSGIDEGITMDIDFLTGTISSPAADHYKDADYMIITYAGEVYTNIQDLQIYNVSLTTSEWGTGIQTVTDAKTTNAPTYNLMGQRVNSHFKGIVIKNGEKHIHE